MRYLSFHASYLFWSEALRLSEDISEQEMMCPNIETFFTTLVYSHAHKEPLPFTHPRLILLRPHRYVWHLRKFHWIITCTWKVLACSFCPLNSELQIIGEWIKSNAQHVQTTDETHAHIPTRAHTPTQPKGANITQMLRFLLLVHASLRT